MLRKLNTLWNAKYDAECKFSTVNNIRSSGEFIMTSGLSTSYDDPNRPDDFFIGSHYFLTQRLLHRLTSEDPLDYEWISQVAYSYFSPCIGVRTKSGMNTDIVAKNTWSDWEFTVMSGLITETINYNGGIFTFQKHRNSRVCYFGWYDTSIKVTSNVLVQIGVVSEKFRPALDAEYTVRVDTNSGVLPAKVIISSSGSVTFVSSYDGLINPQSLVFFINK